MKKSFFRRLASFSFVVVILTPLTAGAWGRRGHQIVGENAAMLVGSDPANIFMRNHSFDFGYYANVPDFIWKRPATYGAEHGEHYMNIEIFEREFAKHPEISKPFELSRQEFEAKFPDLKADYGRAFWRIRELAADLDTQTQKLREMKDQSGAAKQKLQEKWIVTAGVLAHYVGDLGMPLHVAENHDGAMTSQKGIHSYFEDEMVNRLYPEVGCEVNKDAMKQWPAFSKRNADKSVLQLILELAERTRKQAAPLLAMDKRSKRSELAKNTQMYHPMIRKQLVDSTLVLAEIYRREMGFGFDDNRFYFFAGEPEYIQPGGEKPTAAVKK